MFKLFLLIFLTFPSVSGALTCLKDYAGTASCLENENTAGDCITLGYSTDNVEGCSNYLYCPFNTAYKKCVAGGEKLDCAEIGFTTSDKSSWCDEIITCPKIPLIHYALILAMLIPFPLVPQVAFVMTVILKGH